MWWWLMSHDTCYDWPVEAFAWCLIYNAFHAFMLQWSQHLILRMLYIVRWWYMKWHCQVLIPDVLNLIDKRCTVWDNGERCTHVSWHSIWKWGISMYIVMGRKFVLIFSNSLESWISSTHKKLETVKTVVLIYIYKCNFSHKVCGLWNSLKSVQLKRQWGRPSDRNLHADSICLDVQHQIRRHLRHSYYRDLSALYLSYLI